MGLCSVGEFLPSMYAALGSIPSTEEERRALKKEEEEETGEPDHLSLNSMVILFVLLPWANSGLCSSVSSSVKWELR